MRGINEILRANSWKILPLLILAYVFSYIDRINISFAALGMTSALGLTPEQYGFGAGLFFLGYFVFEVPSNLILRRVGAPVWLFRIAVTWGLCTAALAFIAGEKSFYFLRFLLGVAEAGFVPGMVYYLTYWYPSQQRARIMAMMWASTAIAGVIAGPWSGLILMADGWLGLQGWQLIFILQGLPTVVIGVAMLKMLPRSVAQAKWLTEAERNLLVQEVEADLARNRNNVSDKLSSAMRDYRVWLLATVYFMSGIGFFGMLMWLPQVVKQVSNLGNVQVSFLSSIPFLLAAVAMILNGWHSDRTGERRWHLAVPYFVGGSGFLVSATASDPVVAFVAICLAMTGMLSPVGVFWSLPTAFLSGAAAAAGLALINAVGASAGFLGPYIVGILRGLTGDFKWALIVLAGSAFATAALAALLPYNRIIAQRSTGNQAEGRMEVA